MAGDGGTIANNGGNVTITNCIFTNNTASKWGGAITISSGGNISIENCIFNNNIANYGGAIVVSFQTGNFRVNNCTFNNNTANFDGGAIYNINNNYIEVNNSTFINNVAKGTGGGAINLNGGNYTTISNSNFVNNTLSNTDSSGGAILNYEGNYLTILNCNFTNNKNSTYGGAISNILSNNVTITSSNFNNNTAISGGSAIFNDGDNLTITSCNFTDNKDSSVIYIYKANTTTIQNSNIYNNTKGIFISNESYNAIINYNRIFNNTAYDLNNTGNNTNADLNWWGNNTPTKIIGITPNNHFIMNVTNLTSTVTNGIATFKYTFGLNTSDQFDPNLLPYFVTNVYTNVTSGIQQTFDARFNKTVSVNTDKGGQNVTYTFITDNEIKNINLFVEPTPTNIVANNPKGKNGETVDLIAKLTDKNGNPLAGKLIVFHIAGITLTAITDANGIAKVQYTINKEDFTNKKLAFTATFEGDDNYLSNETIGTVTLIEEPVPVPPTPKPDNNSNKNKTSHNPTTKTNAAMKSTGIPINLVLIILLSMISSMYYRKK